MKALAHAYFHHGTERPGELTSRLVIAGVSAASLVLCVASLFGLTPWLTSGVSAAASVLREHVDVRMLSGLSILLPLMGALFTATVWRWIQHKERDRLIEAGQGSAWLGVLGTAIYAFGSSVTALMLGCATTLNGSDGVRAAWLFYLIGTVCWATGACLLAWVLSATTEPGHRSSLLALIDTVRVAKWQLAVWACIAAIAGSGTSSTKWLLLTVCLLTVQAWFPHGVLSRLVPRGYPPLLESFRRHGLRIVRMVILLTTIASIACLWRPSQYAQSSMLLGPIMAFWSVGMGFLQIWFEGSRKSARAVRLDHYIADSSCLDEASAS